MSVGLAEDGQEDMELECIRSEMEDNT
jgi:hypothetical protein